MKNDFEVIRDGNDLNVRLGKDLSISNATLLTEELTKYVGQGIERIIFDATGLTFLSSSGIRSLLFAYKDISSHPEVIFLNCAKDIYEVLNMVGMTTVIKFKEDQVKRDEYRQKVLYDYTLEEAQQNSKNRKSELEQFAAENDVVCYSMKLGKEE